MSKFVVIVFPDEARAYEATRVLRELHSEGSLTLHGVAVIAADDSGKLAVKQAADTGPLGVGVGALAGGLVGLLGGPVGAAIGMSYGALIGGISDIFNAGVGRDFITAVMEKLSPHNSAVIAEVSEEWVTPLDTRMEGLGGTVIREWRSDFEDDQIEREIKLRRAELDHLTAEFDHAEHHKKPRLNARMDELQNRLLAGANRVSELLDQLALETEAKLEQLQDQSVRVRGDAREKIDQQIADLQTDYRRRSEKLKEAWELTREAFVA